MTRPTRTPKRGLTFTEGNHTYRLDGQWCPGVTGILGCLDKPAIPKWAAGTVAEYVADQPDAIETLRSLGRKAMVNALKEIPWQKRDTQGARGTNLHDVLEHLLRDEEVDVDDEYVPVIEHALQFLEDWAIEPLLTEAAVGSREHRYAGKLDMIARYRRPDTGHEGTAILDWKSGKMIYPEAAMQMTAYAFAEFHGLNGDEQPVPACDAAFGVHIRADGCDAYELRFGPEVFDEFLAIRRAYDVTKRMRGDWKTPGSGYVSAAIYKRGEAA